MVSLHHTYGITPVQGLYWNHPRTSMRLSRGLHRRALNKHMCLSSIIKCGLTTYLPWARGLVGAWQTKVLHSRTSQSSGDSRPSQLWEQPEQEKSKQKQQSGQRHGGKRLLRMSNVVSWLEELQLWLHGEAKCDETGETV